MSDLARIAAVLGLVGANAFFVIGEYAVVTARRAALRRRAAAGSPGARVALRLMDDPVRVISTVQVGITAIGILIGAIGEPLVREVIGDGLAPWLGFLIAFSIVTYLSVVLGELVPKAVTLARAETLAILVAPAIHLTSLVLRPPAALLAGSARLLLKPFGITAVIAGDTVRDVDELRAMVDEAEQVGVIPEAQEEMLDRVFELVGREARDVMVPALEVDWLDASLTLQAALARVAETRRARYPVADGSLDRLRGVVSVHDLLAGDAATVGDVVREAYVVPETKDLGALLAHWRREGDQLAIVLDEYGAFAGIVTLHDVSEELIGEIHDEYELPDDRLSWVDEQTVRVAGSMTIDDFNEEIGTSLPQDGPRTMAGLVLEGLGRHPAPGERVELDGASILVEEVDELRIARLAVTLSGVQRPS